MKLLSRVWLCATPWTVAHQAPPSLGFSRREHWSGLPFPPPGDIPDPGIEPASPTLQADALPSDHQGSFICWPTVLLLRVCMLSRFSHVQLCATLWTVACQVSLSLGFPGKNTGVGCHAHLQGIFPTQGLDPDLPHCRQILYQLSHKGSPSILEWVAYPLNSQWI